MSKSECEQLYEDFLRLKEKTHISVENYTPGKPISASPLKLEDLLKKEEVRQRLLHCKNQLNLGPEEWFEIENS